jgi:hypothetical protein
MGTKYIQYSTRWRFLLLRNRGVNIPLHHLRATTVLTASYVFGNGSREDDHTVSVFFKTSTQPPISGS